MTCLTAFFIHNRECIADNTSITFASCEVEEISRCVNLDLDRIRIWLAANMLYPEYDEDRISADWLKTKLNFTSSPAIKINQIPVKQVSATKFLGVYIDENLTWERHITEHSKIGRFWCNAPINI